MWGINPYWGVLSTPVINLTTGILYVVAASSPDGSMGKITYQLHSLRLADGSNVAAPLTLDGASFQTPGSPVAHLGDVARKQRPALTLSSRQGVETVFVAFGSFMESAPTNVGIVVAVDVTHAQAPAIAAVWATGGGKYPSAGIWQAGAGLSVDDGGYLHGMTGNGAFDPQNGYFGNCFFRLQYTPRQGAPPANLRCVGWWLPYSDAARAGDDPTGITPTTDAPDYMDPQPTNAVNNTSNAHLVGDQDLGSGGALSLPARLTGYGKDVIVGGGKDGIFYVLDGSNLGQTLPGDFAPAKINGNWAKLLSPPWAATFSGLGLDLAPTQLDTLPRSSPPRRAHDPHCAFHSDARFAAQDAGRTASHEGSAGGESCDSSVFALASSAASSSGQRVTEEHGIEVLDPKRRIEIKTCRTFRGCPASRLGDAS
jgi:hypothetical protein